MTSHDLFLLLFGVNELRFYSSCPSGKRRSKTGSCVECPAGYFDRDCSKVCTDNTYGIGCRKHCSCTPEFCDPIIGCTNNSSTSNTTSPSTINVTVAALSKVQFILHLSITLATVGFILIVFTVGVFCRCVRQRRQHKEERVPTGDGAGSRNDEGIDVGLSDYPLYEGVSSSAKVCSSPSEI